MSESEKQPCTRCGAMILPTTARATSGLCMPCFNAHIPQKQQSVLLNVSWMNKILVSGCILAGVIVITKLVGKSTITWSGINLTLGNAWLVFAIFTGAHIYTSFLIRQAVISLLLLGSREECGKTYADIVTSGGLFVRGMIPRTEVKRLGNKDVYQMAPTDPSTWLAHGAALLLFVATIPFAYSGFFQFVGWIVLALVLVNINWLFGSMWAIAVSRLADPPTLGERRS